jgi:hypothetical protein
MQFDSEKDAKHHVMALMAGTLSPRDATQRLADAERYRERASNAEERDYWSTRADALQQWIESDTFRSGAYAQGIDSEFLELVEWRAQIAALVETPSDPNPFVRSEFFARWLVGASYAVLILLGRLVSRDKRDNSMANAWGVAIPYLSSSTGFSREEVRALEEIKDQSRGRFTRARSDTVRFRNKTVAHNEATLRIAWESVDQDVRILARIWAVLIRWAGGPVLFPFRNAGEVFGGLGAVYSTAEFDQLCNRRDQYLEQTKRWCITNVVTNGVDPSSSPFATLNVSVDLRGAR